MILHRKMDPRMINGTDTLYERHDTLTRTAVSSVLVNEISIHPALYGDDVSCIPHVRHHLIK